MTATAAQKVEAKIRAQAAQYSAQLETLSASLVVLASALLGVLKKVLGAERLLIQPPGQIPWFRAPKFRVWSVGFLGLRVRCS